MTDTRTLVAVPALILRRTYAAPRQRVFDAWTEPELAMKFLGPGDVTVPEVRMGVRTGGSFSIVMLMPDGERWNVSGTYRDVRPLERLSMTPGAGKKTSRRRVRFAADARVQRTGPRD